MSANPWTMNERWPENYRSPFDRAHCGVDALAVIADFCASEAHHLAELGRSRTSTAMPERNLLMRAGSTWYVDLEQWARLIEHRVVQQLKFAPARWIKYCDMWRREGWSPCVTLRTFCKQHPTGRWYVCSRSHAVAVIDGVPYGQYWMNSRVQRAAQLERAT